MAEAIAGARLPPGAVSLRAASGTCAARAGCSA